MCPDYSVILQSCKIWSVFFNVFLMSEYSVFVEHRAFKVSIGSVFLFLFLHIFIGFLTAYSQRERERYAKIYSCTCGFVCFLQLCQFGFIYS